MNQLHQSLTPERYTPAPVSEALHRLYPDGFFDYASCELANQVMGAAGYYTREDDTLSRSLMPDGEPVDGFANPPGGKVRNRSLQRLFWERLLAGYRAGEIRSLVFLCFNLNAGPALCPEMLLYPRVYTTVAATSPCVNASGRMRFLASKAELNRVLENELAQAELGSKRFKAIEAKRHSLAAMPVAVPGTDLVQESAPTNPGQFIFLPPRDEGWKQDHQLRTFKKEFEIFGTWAPGRLYG